MRDLRIMPIRRRKIRRREILFFRIVIVRLSQQKVIAFPDKRRKPFHVFAGDTVEFFSVFRSDLKIVAHSYTAVKNGAVIVAVSVIAAADKKTYRVLARMQE